MRRSWHRPIVAVLLITFAAKAHGQAAASPRSKPDAAVEVRKRQQMESILALWEKESAARTSVNARFVRLDTSKVWGNTEYQGQAFLQRPELARLDLSKRDAAKKPPGLIPHEQIVCTGNHILQFAHETQQVFVFPLAKDARKRALDEGPLPFLFNTRAAELKQRYQLWLADENPDLFLIGVLPRWESDKETFSRAYIWLNKKRFLPDKLLLVAPNEQDRREYTFKEITENQPVDPETFRPRKPPGWTVVNNPAATQAPPARAGARPLAGERK
jgi:TIGR03009 family protein